MVKKVYPITWDTENGKWLLRYETTAGNVQNVLSEAKIALENYLNEFMEFQKALNEKTH